MRPEPGVFVFTDTRPAAAAPCRFVYIFIFRWRLYKAEGSAGLYKRKWFDLLLILMCCECVSCVVFVLWCWQQWWWEIISASNIFLFFWFNIKLLSWFRPVAAAASLNRFPVKVNNLYFCYCEQIPQKDQNRLWIMNELCIFVWLISVL